MNGIHSVAGRPRRSERPLALWLLPLLAIMPLVLAGCHRGMGNVAGHHDSDGSAAQAPNPDVVELGPDQQREMNLKLSAVKVQPLSRSFTTTVPVTVPSGASATVVSPVTGTLDLWHGRLPVPGAWVRAGEPLIVVRQSYNGAERTQMVIALRQAQTQAQALRTRLAADQAEATRLARLYDDGIAPLAQVQQSRATVATDQAGLAAASARQQQYTAALRGATGASRFVLRAPIAGRVTSVRGAPGQMVSAAQRLFRIVNDHEIWLQVPIPETAVVPAAQARHALFRVAAFPGRWFPLRRVGSPGVLNERTHTLPVIFAAANPSGRFEPGMIATVQVLTPARRPLPVVPASALVQEGAVTVVFVAISKDHFRRTPVEVSYQTGGQAAIGRGLQPGERVVAAGAALVESELHVGSVKGDDD